MQEAEAASRQPLAASSISDQVAAALKQIAMKLGVPVPRHLRHPAITAALAERGAGRPQPAQQRLIDGRQLVRYSDNRKLRRERAAKARRRR